ncbi:hypothetical protein ABHB54_13150, partial [Flavonifractor plautii]
RLGLGVWERPRPDAHHRYSGGDLGGFASQALAVIRTLGMDPARVNPWGGAMALGHPLGATGAMLTCKALSYLERTGGRYGMVTMCIGGGMGAAGIFERL